MTHSDLPGSGSGRDVATALEAWADAYCTADHECPIPHGLVGEVAAALRSAQERAQAAEKDEALFNQLLEHYVAVDFADEQFPDQTVLKFAFPNGATVGADLRATLRRFASRSPQSETAPTL